MRYVLACMVLFILLMIKCVGITEAYRPSYKGYDLKQYVQYNQEREMDKLGLAHKYQAMLNLTYNKRR